jgi:dTDP-4-dehydrorhamnose reductase
LEDDDDDNKLESLLSTERADFFINPGATTDKEGCEEVVVVAAAVNDDWVEEPGRTDSGGLDERADDESG